MTGPLAANVERFNGVSECYDAHRPQPPAVLVDILTQLAGVERPRLVVDLGSGTGLSTRIWAGRATEAVGIEPNDDMRRQAEARTAALPNAVNVRYQKGLSTQTGLPDGSADIVTCSQSLHWMEPEPTFAEVARVLRTEGVFAAFDCDWPPAIHWEAEAAYIAFLDQVRRVENERGVYEAVKRWSKKQHLDRMRDSGRFRFIREIAVHHTEAGDAERLIQLALSQGSVSTLLRRGVTDEEIGLDRLREAVRGALGDRTVPWYFSYRVRLGIT